MMEARSPTAASRAGLATSEIELQGPPASSGMARPGSHEATANRANDAKAAGAPGGVATRVKAAILSCFWECEEHLADLFGLNDSKYQWALDRHFAEKKEAEDRAAFEGEEEEAAQAAEEVRAGEDADALEGGGEASASVRLTSEAGAK
mmetsp:Transcript_35185/g.56541  ORF Transcript_35185/g.56541 Transcript_35185/m.56541 type:complete len:149 (+) Transcript_35185:53-499(+)